MNLESKIHERTDGILTYDDSYGLGELVLMEPGMGALHSEYRFLASVMIEANYRTVTADLRGHGESSPGWSEYSLAAADGDILGLNEHLDSGPVYFIGTSFSPEAAVWAEVKRSEAKWIVDLQDAEMLLVEGAGHYPQTEIPEKLAPVILNFLESA